MAVVLRGDALDSNAEWYPVRQDPPRRGDLIVMGIPATSPLPGSGWTRVGDGQPYAWRYADGTETGFPFPAAWFSGAVVDGEGAPTEEEQ